MDSHPLPPLTAPEKDRIDRAEQAIVGLSGRMDGVESRLSGVENAVTKTNDGVQILLSRTGTLEASRGTVPVQTLLAALALFLTLVGIGLKFLSDLETKVDTRITNVVRQEDLQHALSSAKLSAVRDQVFHQLEVLDSRAEKGEDSIGDLNGTLTDLGRDVAVLSATTDPENLDQYLEARIESLKQSLESVRREVRDPERAEPLPPD
jgi:hypothetical protein